MKKTLMTVVFVQDLFVSPFNGPTKTKPKRFNHPRTIAQEWLNTTKIYPKTSQLNRYRKDDGSLACGERTHRYTHDAVIEFSELHKYIALRQRPIGSVDGVKTYQVVVDGDGVLQRDANKRPLCDPPLDGLPFAENAQSKPKKVKAHKPVQIKVVAADSKPKIKQVQAQSKTNNDQIEDLPARSSRSIWQRVKAVFVGGVL